MEGRKLMHVAMPTLQQSEVTPLPTYCGSRPLAQLTYQFSEYLGAPLPPLQIYRVFSVIPCQPASEPTLAETPPWLPSHQRKHKSYRDPPSLAHFFPLALSTALALPAPSCLPCQIFCSSLTHTPSWKAYG